MTKTYQEIFTLEMDEVDHGDPHLLFENWAKALNSGNDVVEEVKIKWDCQDHQYTFMVQDER